RFSSPSSSEKPIHLTLLFLQVASVSCPICQSPFFFHRFAPGSSAIRKPDRLLSSAWGLSSVSLRFLSRRLPLFPRSLPLALPGSRPCAFPCPQVHRRNASARERACHLPVLPRRDIGAS